MDIVLVGDSAAMMVLGHSSTVPATMDEMLMLASAVTRVTRRAARRRRTCPSARIQGLGRDGRRQNAVRFVKEGGADVVKIEGAGRCSRACGAIGDAGIPVMGHIGLTPQSATMLGGYKAQGRSAGTAQQLFEDALALGGRRLLRARARGVPPQWPRASRVRCTSPPSASAPERSATARCWSGTTCSALYPGHAPRFVKRYADLATVARDALETYADDVRSGCLPRGAAHVLDPRRGARAVRAGSAGALGEDRGGEQQAEQRGGERRGAERARDAPALDRAHADDREQQ